MGTYYYMSAMFRAKKGTDPADVEKMFEGFHADTLDVIPDGDHIKVIISTETSYSEAAEFGETIVAAAKKFADWEKGILDVTEETDEGQETWYYGLKKRCVSAAGSAIKDKIEALMKRIIVIEEEAAKSRDKFFKATVPEVD